MAAALMSTPASISLPAALMGGAEASFGPLGSRPVPETHPVVLKLEADGFHLKDISHFRGFQMNTTEDGPATFSSKGTEHYKGYHGLQGTISGSHVSAPSSVVMEVNHRRS